MKKNYLQIFFILLSFITIGVPLTKHLDVFSTGAGVGGSSLVFKGLMSLKLEAFISLSRIKVVIRSTL